ncbi:efflux RND transporter permease subunit [Vibrio europaeus]|uniref:efflux RND transporter permease subunit n=1 Tax=Vibrio europaeus TaxID=300876 RepID=UPI00233EB78C|nr:efflux RND transporter permease subunit [Vibrio europaeus]MDC5721784.1 efflux RND transporter permease subunit [Vibrio europaeus]MDC5758174.1 efflux RND transporter permease subunit [Vibrio europaeus]MDC5776451.1 efflux RND transporter permease subunit [Vibrio europaeus]MDC5795690.1 efflux RND transporter permease subunit [Vibrio europaeus]MDC5801633.1 efflux RND transporter permease subunit [Vibrio europaeus]
MNIAKQTIAKRTSVWVLVALMLFGGYISYLKLGRFEDPEFIIRQSVIVTPYPGATAQEVVDEVTDVIEGAAQSLQEVSEITSVSKQGMSEVTVEIKREFSKTEAELQQVWDKLRRKVADAQRSLPPGVAPSIVNDDFADVYSQFYAVTGEGFSDKQLQDYVDTLRRELVLVPGVSKTATFAEKQDTIFVEISNDRLTQFGMSIDQVYQVLEKQNVVTVAGALDADGMRVSVIPSANISSFEQLKTLQVGLGENNTIMRLQDIATVTRGYEEPASVLMRYNGERAVGLGISNVAGGNVVEMGDAVKARIAELDSQRPHGIELNEISIQSDSVRESVADFINNLIAAVVIVFVVLLLFMGLRTGLVIGFVLVLTVAGTLIVMLIDDIAMQRISLGALIIALGMLVDNAIVVTDGVLTRLQNNPEANKQDVVNDVVNETKWPLLGGTIVGICAFSAIGLSPSDMGEYAGSLFWVILYSMFLSWVLAITVTPLLCHDFLKVSKAKQTDAPSKVSIWYKSTLEWVLNNQKKGLVGVIVLFVLGVKMFSYVPPGFMPESQREQFVIDVYLPQGTDIRTTENVMLEIEQDVLAKEGVTNTTSFIGSGGLRFMLIYSPEAQNTSYAQMLVSVDDFSAIEPLIAELQTELADRYEQASVNVWKFMLGPGGGKKIEAAFSGPDSAVLRKLVEQAKQMMDDTPELMAIQDDWRQQVPVVQPVYASDKAQQFGLTTQELNQALEQSLVGRNVGVYRERNDLIPIVVRATDTERSHVRSIENTTVFSPTAGQYLQLAQFIERVELEWQDSMLRRVDRIPTIMAQADPRSGILTSEALEAVKEKIESMPLPVGYQLEWHGEYKDAKEADEGLLISAPYGFAAMVLAVVFMFNGIRQALVIWCTVPLALLGVAIGLVMFQTPFEFMATLGLLSLIGMMVKNAIVLVDQAENEIANGKTAYDAIIDAAMSRARPVILGATTTILGVAPLLVDPFFKSMAVTIMFGLLFATVLTLIVIPLNYALFFRVKPNQPQTVKLLS